MKPRLCLIVSGSRRLRPGTHGPAIAAWIKKQRAAHRSEYSTPGHLLLIHGGQAGAERLANDAAAEFGFDTWPIPYFSEFDQPGQHPGGPERNRCMIDIAVVLRQTGIYEIKMGAFPDEYSKGTHQAVAYAKTKKIIAEVFKQ